MVAGVTDFPLLSDLEDEVYDTLGHPRTQAGVPPWQPREVQRAFNRAQTWLWGKLSDLDKDWGIKVATLTVTSGSRVVSLGNLLGSNRTDFRALRHLVEINADGEEGDVWDKMRFDDAGSVTKAYVLQRDQKQLYLLWTPQQAYTLRLTYNYSPLPLAHGTVRTAGQTSTQLAAYESGSDSELVGQAVTAFAGTGSGQTITYTSWDGETRSGAHLAVATTFSSDTRYTTRPPFLVGAREAFFYATLVYLGEKHADDRIPGWKMQAREALNDAMIEEIRAERSGDQGVRDPLGFASFEMDC